MALAEEPLLLLKGLTLDHQVNPCGQNIDLG